MDEKRKFEVLKDMALSDGGKILIEDIKANKDSSDTIFVMPIIDERSNMIISPTQDELFKRMGYVSALNWLIGVLEYYQSGEYQDLDDEV
jgi:hypothetical protein